MIQVVAEAEAPVVEVVANGHSQKTASRASPVKGSQAAVAEPEALENPE